MCACIPCQCGILLGAPSSPEQRKGPPRSEAFCVHPSGKHVMRGGRANFGVASWELAERRDALVRPCRPGWSQGLTKNVDAAFRVWQEARQTQITTPTALRDATAAGHDAQTARGRPHRSFVQVLLLPLTLTS